MKASILLLTILTSSLFSFGQTWISKIDPAVWQSVANGEAVEFLVVLSEQADLSEAAFLPKKEDKGTYVFQQLSATAERTQTELLQVLNDFAAPHHTYWVINAVWAKGGKSLLETIAKMPEVAAIHGNPIVQMEAPQRGETSGERTVEWGITDINADDVWAMGYTGENVVVGGQDTGYDWDVPALKLKYRGWDAGAGTADHNYNWHDAIHFNIPPALTPNPCGYDSTEPCDDHNHGTHTMGTMVGSEGVNEIGVAPDAKWIGCRNMDQNNGTPTTYIECFQWFLAPTDLNNQNPDASKAPHVINNSWYCPIQEGCDSGNWADMELAINNLIAAGVVVVVSAGNSGASGCSTVDAPPAMFAGSLAVGANDITNTIASFSSRGPVTEDGSNRMKPDVTAPGVGVRSCIRNGAYASWGGTSMAGPHVAGSVALLIDANPSLAGNVTLIRSLLENTAGGQTTSQGCGGDSPTDSPNNTYGNGIINAEAAVIAALALLPVELIEFRANLSNAGVQLVWETALPGTLNHFEIEHSSQSNNWETIGKIAFSPNEGRYSLLDPNPKSGIHFYRLKMMDIDGSFEYSKVISVKINDHHILSISPNPVRDELSLLADWESGPTTLFIFAANGSIKKTMKKVILENGEAVNLEVADLPSGVYFLKIIDNNGQQLLFQSRFVKI